MELNDFIGNAAENYQRAKGMQLNSEGAHASLCPSALRNARFKGFDMGSSRRRINKSQAGSTVLLCNCDGVKMSHRSNIERAVGGARGGADRVVQFNGAEQFLFFAGREHIKTAATRAQINFAIGDQRRGPYFTVHSLRPIWFAGGGVNAVNGMAAVGDEHQAIVNGGRRKHMLLQWIGPHHSIVSDV